MVLLGVRDDTARGSLRDTCKNLPQEKPLAEWELLRLQRLRFLFHIQEILPKAFDVFSHVGT